MHVQQEATSYEPNLRDALAVIGILADAIDTLCTKIDGLQQTVDDLQQDVAASRTAS